MRQKKNSYSGPLSSLMIVLISTISTYALRAQAQTPSAGASVVVRMMDAVDSDKDPPGKQYRAAVAEAVDAGNGVVIPKGAAADVTLASNGSTRTAQLSSVEINGGLVAVASSSAKVTAAQSATGSAVHAMSSIGGAFGHHASALAAISAVATGQRVLLPPGTTLTFVLSQPPASSQAMTTAPSSQAGQPAMASPVSTSAHPSGAAIASAPGQHWWMCRYADKKDPAKPALGQLMYYALIPVGGDDSKLNGHFNGYVQQNYKVTNNESSGIGFCRRFPDDAAGRANSMDMMLKQWASNNIEAVNIKWTDSPAEDAAIDAHRASPNAASAAASSSGANSKECAYHATCVPTPATGQKPPNR